MVVGRKIPAFMIFFLLITFASARLFAVKVSSEIDQGTIYENQPFKVSVTVTHDASQVVDIDSFLLGKKKVPVELMKEVKISPSDPLTLSIYSLSVPGQKEGLYALPAVSVKVDGQTYQSIMSSYKVEPATNGVPQVQPVQATPAVPSAPQQETQAVSAPKTQPQLRLEAIVQGSSSLFPGQRTVLVYRYYFSGDIALTTETLPLLDAEGMIKIGEKEINDSVEGGISVREITQQVEAVKPGKFSFGPSLIEGFSYKEDASGNPVLTSEKLTSKAEPVVITVMPFPEQNKPASFNGAVGQFSFKTSLLSPSEMGLGDEISLLLEVSGKGNLKNVTISNLCCQPGFSGFFKLSDLPPSEEIDGNTKKIVAKFRPLNAQIKEIPSLEFSFFDPESENYTALHSDPISITVRPGSRNFDELKDGQEAAESEKTTEEPEKKIAAEPAPIEIETIVPLSTEDLYNKLFGSWWAMGIIPLGIMLLIYQSHLKNYLDWQSRQVRKISSKELFRKAFADERSGKIHFDLLKQSFKLSLVEAGLLSSSDVSDKELPDEGIVREVKVFLSFLDEKQYSGKERYDAKEIHRLSSDLMARVKSD